MTDQEEIIRGLQIERECVSRDCDRDCARCDLVQDRNWLLSVYDGALELLQEQENLGEELTNAVELIHKKNKRIEELLKKQEAVKPVKQIEENEWTVCGHCRKHIISKWMFCPYCGRAVKWE